MTALTLKAWRRAVAECADDEGVTLTGSEVRAVASLAMQRHEARLDDNPADYRIRGITNDPTPRAAIHNILNAVAAARRTAA